MRQGKDGHNHVSQSFAYARQVPRLRVLAYLQPVYVEYTEKVVAYIVRLETGSRFLVKSHQQLVELMVIEHLDVYVKELYGKRGYIWLEEAIASKDCKGFIAESSKQLVSLSIRHKNGKKSRTTVKIISARCWEYDCTVDMEFLRTIRMVFDLYGWGVHPSPGALGYESMSQHHKSQGFRPISRPSAMLRKKLFDYSSGGRADDFSLSTQYRKVWVSDADNSYASQAANGVPSGREVPCECIGFKDVFTSDTTILEEFRASWCQARITIPVDFHNKISPIYKRESSGLLRWITTPGVYEGYWWSDMIARCIRAGFIVELAYCWCWRELDKFLVEWILEIIELREWLRNQPKYKRVADIVKRIIVSAIGRFGMHDSTTTLILREHRQEGDEPFMNLNAVDDEPLSTPYYTRTVDEPDSKNLTQVASYIIMKNNVALYDRAIGEELNGNEVISTNYDSIVTTKPPTLEVSRGLGKWKVEVHNHYTQKGLRSHESDESTKRPGVKRLS